MVSAAWGVGVMFRGRRSWAQRIRLNLPSLMFPGRWVVWGLTCRANERMNLLRYADLSLSLARLVCLILGSRSARSGDRREDLASLLLERCGRTIDGLCGCMYVCVYICALRTTSIPCILYIQGIHTFKSFIYSRHSYIRGIHAFKASMHSRHPYIQTHLYIHTSIRPHIHTTTHPYIHTSTHPTPQIKARAPVPSPSTEHKAYT